MRLILIMFLMYIIGYEIKDKLIEINKNLETLISLDRGEK